VNDKPELSLFIVDFVRAETWVKNKYVILSNNNCIEWTFPELPGGNADTNEKARRRRIRDYVGLEHFPFPCMIAKCVDRVRAAVTSL
jgi:hypothetical protein